MGADVAVGPSWIGARVGSMAVGAAVGAEAHELKPTVRSAPVAASTTGADRWRLDFTWILRPVPVELDDLSGDEARLVGCQEDAHADVVFGA